MKRGMNASDHQENKHFDGTGARNDDAGCKATSGLNTPTKHADQNSSRMHATIQKKSSEHINLLFKVTWLINASFCHVDCSFQCRKIAVLVIVHKNGDLGLVDIIPSKHTLHD
jgi:hypothetical protein